MEFNLNDIYRNIFGYKGIPGTYSNLKTHEPGELSMMPVKLGDWQLPIEPLISLNFSKTIIKTSFDGTSGAFKEFFNIDDAEIVIKGILINTSDPENYPINDVRKLRQLFEINKSVAIACDKTTAFNIKLMSIDKIDLTAVEAMPGTQPYVIYGWSDREYDLEYKRKNNAV